MTETIPKSLIEIGGHPFVNWQLQLLSKSGIEKVVLCIGYKSEMIQEFVGDGTRYGIEVVYSRDGSTQLGTGGAIRKAIPKLGDEFMVLYGDSYLPTDYKAVEAAFHSAQMPALMTVFFNKGAFDTSNVLFAHGKLLSYAKQDQVREMAHIDYGLSVFNSSVFEPYPMGVPLDLSEVFTNLSTAGSLAGYVVQERFYEIGSPEGIEDFSEYIGRSGHVL